jgi:hypothetical protein
LGIEWRCVLLEQQDVAGMMVDFIPSLDLSIRFPRNAALQVEPLLPSVRISPLVASQQFHSDKMDDSPARIFSRVVHLTANMGSNVTCWHGVFRQICQGGAL